MSYKRFVTCCAIIAATAPYARADELDDGEEAADVEGADTDTDTPDVDESDIEADTSEDDETGAAESPLVTADPPPCEDVYAGAEPNGGVEANGNLPDDYMLVGIGGRVNDDRLTTLWLRGIKINADGTMGETITRKFGSSARHRTEVFVGAPAGSGIVGLGLGADRGTLKVVEIYHKPYDSSTHLFLGGSTRKARGSGGIEARFSGESNLEVSLGGRMITGVGARVRGGRVVTLRIRYCPIP